MITLLGEERAGLFGMLGFVFLISSLGVLVFAMACDRGTLWTVYLTLCFHASIALWGTATRNQNIAI